MNQRLEMNAFTVAVEYFLQRDIEKGEVNVRMGTAKKARGFDAVHDNYEIMFIIDHDYVTDPEEAYDMLEKLVAWIDGWNDIEWGYVDDKPD